MSALYIAGTEDHHFPIAGTNVLYSLDDALAFWAGRNHCRGPRTRQQLPDRFDDGTTVFRTQVGGCADGSRLWLDSIVGGGHTWPGNGATPSAGGGVTSEELSANDEIGRFLAGLTR